MTEKPNISMKSIAVVSIIIIITVAVTALFTSAILNNQIKLGGLGSNNNGNNNTTTDQTPTGVITKCEKSSGTTEKIYLGQFKPNTTWDKIKIMIENKTAGSTQSDTYLLKHGINGALTSASSGGTGFTLTGTDMAGDNKISNGDYVLFNGLSELGNNLFSYRISIIYIPSDSLICEKSFNF